MPNAADVLSANMHHVLVAYLEVAGTFATVSGDKLCCPATSTPSALASSDGAIPRRGDEEEGAKVAVAFTGTLKSADLPPSASTHECCMLLACM